MRFLRCPCWLKTIAWQSCCSIENFLFWLVDSFQILSQNSVLTLILSSLLFTDLMLLSCFLQSFIFKNSFSFSQVSKITLRILRCVIDTLSLLRTFHYSLHVWRILAYFAKDMTILSCSFLHSVSISIFDQRIVCSHFPPN